MATDTDIAKGLAVGLISSQLAVNATATNPINPQQANQLAAVEVSKQRSRDRIGIKAADGGAGLTTAETSLNIGSLFQGRVVGAFFTPVSGGLVQDAANYATITLSARPAAGGASVAFATLATTVAAAGSMTQYVRKVIPLVAAGVDLAAGQDITLTIAKTGTGVVVPAGYFTIMLEDT